MSSDDFFSSRPRTTLPPVEDGLQLATPVLHPATAAEAASRLGITVDELARVARGGACFFEGRVLVGDEVHAHEGAFETGAMSIAELVAARPEIADLVVTSVPAPVALANGERVRGRLSPLDGAFLALFEASRIASWRAARNVPAFILRIARQAMQRAFDDLLALHVGTEPTLWMPSSEIVTGELRDDGPVVGPTQDPPHRRSGLAPLDAWLMESSVLVMFEFASLTIGFDGSVDLGFPSFGLRPVADDGRYIQFALGGGPTSYSGYFDPAVVAVLDTVEGGWLVGELPRSLPQYVAGDVSDVKASAVFRLDRSEGYYVSPYFFHGDRCGETRTDASARYVYDGDCFVREVETGHRVFDARHLLRRHRESLGFVAVSSFVEIDGRFVFVIRNEDDDEDEDGEVARSRCRLIDEDGEVLRIFEPGEIVVLDTRRRMLIASQHSVRVVDAVTAEEIVTIDLTPLARSLAVPAYEPHWEGLLATFGTCVCVGKATVEDIDTHLLATTWAELDDEVLAACVVEARQYPDVPDWLPVHRP